MKSPKWFQIGLKFKKWLLSGILGAVLLLLAMLILLKDIDVGPVQLGASIVLAVLGIYFIILCFRNIFIKFVNVYSSGILRKPSNVREIGDVIYKRKVLSMGPKIVAIGGGTGISSMLRGLKEYTSNITAIITVADDGGGSGTLRNDLGMLPPGDIRNCLIALAETEPVMERLFNYRFKEGSLKGQSFGNLFLAAMNGIADSFEQAVKHMGQVLAVTGRVLPVTEDNIYLVAELEDGTYVRGESNIGHHHLTHPGKIRRVMIDKPGATPLPQVIQAIHDADIVILGPGSLYTSIIPNLLVDGVAQAVFETRAIRIYVCNIMTQPGETEGYTASEHIRTLFEHAKRQIVDVCLVNNGKVPSHILRKYADDGAAQVKVDADEIKRMGINLVERNLVKINNDLIRHDPQNLTQAIADIYKMYS